MCCIEWIWYAGRVGRCAIWLVALAPIRVVSHSERLVLPQNLLTADIVCQLSCEAILGWPLTSHKYQSINHQVNQNQSDNLNVLGEFQLSKGYLQKVIHISFLYEVKPFEGVLVPLNLFLLLWQLFMALVCFYKATTSWWDICALPILHSSPLLPLEGICSPFLLGQKPTSSFPLVRTDSGSPGGVLISVAHHIFCNCSTTPGLLPSYNQDSRFCVFLFLII